MRKLLNNLLEFSLYRKYAPKITHFDTYLAVSKSLAIPVINARINVKKYRQSFGDVIFVITMNAGNAVVTEKNSVLTLTF